MRRRHLLTASLALPLASLIAPEAWAAYPDRPITMIVAFAPGGAVDTAARLVQPVLEEELGTNVEVINAPGASGQIGYTQIANAAPAGSTIAGLLIMEDGRIRSVLARTIQEATRVAAGLGGAPPAK